MKKAGYKELRVYQLAYELSLKVQIITKSFPYEERFSLTDQIRRSSRSVCANIGEGYRKRQYPKNFAKKLSDSNGEATETQIWLDYSKDFGYISIEVYTELYNKYESVGNMLGNMISSPEKFKPRGE
jgi:four helix bundle protein